MAETNAHDEIFYYLRDSRYPNDFTKDQKRNLRKKAQKFALFEDALFFIGHDRSKQPKRWIHDIDEQQKILTACHQNDKIDGDHVGRDRTRRKVNAQYYWNGVTKDCDETVKNCEVCQRANTRKKFRSSNFEQQQVLQASCENALQR
ncbi:hypothetical protein ACROYT_G026496 [Oculina patagonica]